MCLSNSSSDHFVLHFVPEKDTTFYSDVAAYDDYVQGVNHHVVAVVVVGLAADVDAVAAVWVDDEFAVGLN